jgi:hypothetical protein
MGSSASKTLRCLPWLVSGIWPLNLATARLSPSGGAALLHPAGVCVRVGHAGRGHGGGGGQGGGEQILLGLVDGGRVLSFVQPGEKPAFQLPLSSLSRHRRDHGRWKLLSTLGNLTVSRAHHLQIGFRPSHPSRGRCSLQQSTANMHAAGQSTRPTALTPLA